MLQEQVHSLLRGQLETNQGESRGTLMEIEEPVCDLVTLPFWASSYADGDYTLIGAALSTRDGRRCGNGFVNRATDTYYEVVTDAGMLLKLTVEEMSGLFHPPQFIMTSPPPWLIGYVDDLFVR